jgi:hypothetical protein
MRELKIVNCKLKSINVSHRLQLALAHYSLLTTHYLELKP